MRIIFKVITAGLLALCALPVLLLLYALYDDQCHQHWTEQSGLVASRINRLVRTNNAISVRAVAEKRPIFYCLAGPKSDMSDIRKFASGINYRLPDFQFYCGFWSWSGRLLMFYEDFVLDAPIPLSFLDNPDGSEALCFSAASQELRANFRHTRQGGPRSHWDEPAVTVERQADLSSGMPAAWTRGGWKLALAPKGFCRRDIQ
jgi:hypothetical protein